MTGGAAGETWGDVLGAVGKILADRKGVPQYRFDRACEKIVRAVPEDKVRPRAVEVLVAPRPADDTRGPGEEFLGYLFGLRADGPQGPGFVAVLLADGGMAAYRVLKFKSAAEGGNDYVLIERHVPVIEV